MFSNNKSLFLPYTKQYQHSVGASVLWDPFDTLLFFADSKYSLRYTLEDPAPSENEPPSKFFSSASLASIKSRQKVGVYTVQSSSSLLAKINSQYNQLIDEFLLTHFKEPFIYRVDKTICGRRFQLLELSTELRESQKSESEKMFFSIVEKNLDNKFVRHEEIARRYNTEKHADLAENILSELFDAKPIRADETGVICKPVHSLDSFFIKKHQQQVELRQGKSSGYTSDYEECRSDDISDNYRSHSEGGDLTAEWNNLDPLDNY